MTLHIVDLWRYHLCCTKSGATRCTLFMALYLSRMCRACYTRCCDHTSVHLSPPRCRTSQHRRTIILLSVSLWNHLGDPLFDGVGLADFKSRANGLFVGTVASSLFVTYCFSLSLLSLYGLVSWGWGLLTDRLLTTLSQPCTANLFNNKDNNNIIFIINLIKVHL